jgi:hypothetical protein
MRPQSKRQVRKALQNSKLAKYFDTKPARRAHSAGSAVFDAVFILTIFEWFSNRYVCVDTLKIDLQGSLKGSQDWGECSKGWCLFFADRMMSCFGGLREEDCDGAWDCGCFADVPVRFAGAGFWVC